VSKIDNFGPIRKGERHFPSWLSDVAPLKCPQLGEIASDPESPDDTVDPEKSERLNLCRRDFFGMTLVGITQDAFSPRRSTKFWGVLSAAWCIYRSDDEW